MKIKQFHSNYGFTLIEIIVVMSILAIISGILWGNFFTSLTKGRDSRRKQDLESIAKALDLYYFDNKSYPSAFPSGGVSFVNPNNSNVVYMQKIPSDPIYPDQTYCYPTVAGGSYYKIYAKLENNLDNKIIPTVTCDGINYNYGISSSNTKP